MVKTSKLKIGPRKADDYMKRYMELYRQLEREGKRKRVKLGVTKG